MKPNMYHYLQNLKNGRILFDRPKPTAGCSAYGIVVVVVVVVVVMIIIINLETVPGKHSIDSLQKTAILGSHIIQKVLQCEA